MVTKTLSHDSQVPGRSHEAGSEALGVSGAVAHFSVSLRGQGLRLLKTDPLSTLAGLRVHPVITAEETNPPGAMGMRGARSRDFKGRGDEGGPVAAHSPVGLTPALAESRSLEGGGRSELVMLQFGGLNGRREGVPYTWSSLCSAPGVTRAVGPEGRGPPRPPAPLELPSRHFHEGSGGDRTEGGGGRSAGNPRGSQGLSLAS